MAIIKKAEDFLVEVRVNTDPVASPPDVPNGTKIFWDDGGVDRVYIKTQSGVSESGAALESTTASNVGSGTGIFKQLNGTDLEFKSLLAGSNVTLTQSADTIEISATDTGETNVGQNIGPSNEVYSGKAGSFLQFRTLTAGSGITITQNALDLVIDTDGEANEGVNIGAGTGVYSGKVGTNLNFKTLVAGSNVSFSVGADTITIEAASTPPEILTYTSLAQFPATGESSKIYIAEDSDKIYHWRTVQQPETFDHTVGASGDFPDLETALADASVLDGHKIKVLNGTYDLSSQLVISKQVQIFGESKAGVILQSSADGSAPVSLVSVSANDVALVDMTIKHRKTTYTSIENAMAVTGDNFIMSAVQLEYMEFGVVFNAADSWLVKDCDFVYTGVAGNDNRPVGIYGMSGDCFVDGCQFDDNGTAANVKPIFMASQSTSGKLVIDGNSSVNNVHQFVVVENLAGTADSFDLIVKNNTTNETSAYILIAGDSNDVINSITASGNNLSHRHTSGGGGKGIVTFYGTGNWGKIDLHQENNTLQDEFFRGGYTLFSQLKDSLGNPISTGFSAGTSDSFEPTIDVTLDDVIPSNPAQSPVPSLGGGSSDQYVELSEQVDLSGLEADLATEESARIAGDLSIQEYKPDQVIYVSKNGDDSNEGSEQLPFLTLGAALASISDASPTKRYAIRVSSGTYVEASLALKANVFIVGEVAKEAVRIDSAISMDSSFSGSGDHRSGFANVLILKAANFDWSAVTSAAGKLYFSQTVFASTVDLYGHNNAIAQAQFADCQIFGKLTISGINVSVFHNNICWGAVDLNQHPNGGMATIFNAVGGTIGGELKLTTTVDDFNRRCSAFLKSCYTSQITIDGVKSYVDATNDSIPSAGASVLNGGNLVQLNSAGLRTDLSNLSFPTAVNQPIIPANTNSTNMGDWGKQWNWNFAYVHASTGSDLYLISYGSSFGADSTGKSIGIIADGAGLQENVDGGNISLSTASVSGTGVRGKILLDGKEIDVTNKQIKNLADGTDANDAVNKGQLDSLQSQVNSLVSTGQNIGSSNEVFSSKAGTTLQFRTLTAGSGITITQNALDIVIESSGVGEVNTGQNIGSSNEVFSSKAGSTLQFRTLTAGSGITITQNALDLVIDSDGEANEGVNIGAGTGVYSGKVGTNLNFKTLVAGSNVSFTVGVDTITIEAAATGEVNTGQNIGSSNEVFSSKAGSTLQFRTLTAGSGVTITQNALDLVIDSDGEANEGVNIGSGAAIYSGKVGTDLNFKTLVAGSNVSFTVGADTITIEAAAAGEVNTGQNIGSSNEVFSSKAGSTLQFRTLTAGSGITITQNALDLVIEAAGGGGGVTVIPDGGSVAGQYDGTVILEGSADMTSFTTIRGDLIFMGSNSILDDTNGNFLRVHGDIVGPPSGFAIVDLSSGNTGAPFLQCMGDVINVDLYTYNSGSGGNNGTPITIKGSFIGPERDISSYGANSAFPSLTPGNGGNITIGGDCICKTLNAYGGNTTNTCDQNGGTGATVTIGGNLNVAGTAGDTLVLRGGDVAGSGGGRGGTGGGLTVNGDFSFASNGTATIRGGNSNTGNGGFAGLIVVRGNTHFFNEDGSATLDISGGFGGNGPGGGAAQRAVFNGFVNVNGFIRLNGGTGFNGNGGNSSSEVRFLGGVRITVLEMRGGAGSLGFTDGRSSNDALFEGGGYIFNLDLLENNTGANRSNQNTATTLSRGHYQINKVTRVDKALRTPRQRLILRDCVASFGELVDPVTGDGDDALTKPTFTPTADQTITQVSESIYKADTSTIRRSAAFTTL